MVEKSLLARFGILDAEPTSDNGGESTILEEAEEVAAQAWNESETEILEVNSLSVDVEDKDYNQTVNTLNAVFPTEIELEAIAKGLEEGHNYSVVRSHQEKSLRRLPKDIVGELLSAPNKTVAYRIEEEGLVREDRLLSQQERLDLPTGRGMVIFKATRGGRVINALEINRRGVHLNPALPTSVAADQFVRSLPTTTIPPSTSDAADQFVRGLPTGVDLMDGQFHPIEPKKRPF